MPLPKQKDEQAAEQLSKTLKQVMDGVKSQAGHIRGTVAQLEEERDRAIAARKDANRELEVGRRSIILSRAVCSSRTRESNPMAAAPGVLRVARLFLRPPGLSLSAPRQNTAKSPAVCFPVAELA